MSNKYDAVGRLIEVGDLIAFTRRKDSGLTLGVITRFTSQTVFVDIYNQRFKKNGDFLTQSLVKDSGSFSTTKAKCNSSRRHEGKVWDYQTKGTIEGTIIETLNNNIVLIQKNYDKDIQTLQK